MSAETLMFDAPVEPLKDKPVEKFAASIAAAIGGRNANFNFEHKLFTLPGARFALNRVSGEPTFFVMLGDLNAALRPESLCREFHIEAGSLDYVLISMAEKGLRFVEEIRPGDSIPRELLDGTASWRVEERHRMIARVKLIAQVGTRITRGAGAGFTLEKLFALSADPASRDEIQAAFGQLAEEIGVGRQKKQQVIDRVEQFARELAYIEALRDLAAELKMIDRKVAQLARRNQRDRAVTEVLQRVRTLMRRPVTEFDEYFLQVDAQTGEIVVLLKNMTLQMKFIRDTRDELHHRLMKWSDQIKEWRQQEPETGRTTTTQRVDRLYHFLAAHYAPSVEWGA
jgi:hypothetical protein